MTENFNHYSKYYDLLYADKDYKREVKYVLNLIAQNTKLPIKSILELGCGTGIHAVGLAKDGFYVHGVDMSSEMLSLAKIRAEKEGCADSLTFVLGDARNFRVEKNFDAIISLFHVLSYQTNDADLDAMINTASCHLKQDGIFVFDFWYGPAVLWQRPASRVKKLSNKNVEITRFADSRLWDEANAVDVNYSIFIKDLVTNEINEINEIHRMRYLFLPEVDRLLEKNGFSRVSSEEWLTGNAPSVDSWGVCVVARKS